MHISRLLVGAALALAALVGPQPTEVAAQQKHSFAAADGNFLLDGKPFVVRAAELHYPRIPRPYWNHRLKMVKALGMNAVCLYVFWNLHEPEPGVFDFDGQNDVAAFCREAQKEGLWVILRPGPYVCAEWEMGGLPWWLLRHEGVTLRDDDDPYFLDRVAIFEKKVAEELAPLTIENGGPIIMVQVENEYGSYAEDKTYVAKVRDSLRSAGFDKVTLFQCDWASNFTRNGLEDLVWTMNFGTGANIDAQFARLRELRPESPLMCSEYWSGWFDKWGARHETRPADKMVAGISEMLSKNISFSLYMTHGGTSFGHWAGANSPGFAPDVTSYDYDAPIDEQGRPTEKYRLLRDALRPYAGSLPSVPKPIAVMAVDTFAFTHFAPLSAGVTQTVSSSGVRTFEELGLGFGTVVYESTLPSVDGEADLEIHDLHDYASVYVDGQLVGRADRTVGKQSVRLASARAGQKLKIVVEAMGRINFGRAIEDRKGITDHVSLTGRRDGHRVTYTLDGWQMSLIPDSYSNVSRAVSSAQKRTDARAAGDPGYYVAHVNIRRPADTWLDMRGWGKGQLYVNGHPIGRFWAIGPQQTLYVPGCWLRKGDNEIIVADVVGPRRSVSWGSKTAELNLLQKGVISAPDEALSQSNSAGRPNFEGRTPAYEGRLSRSAALKKIDFASPANGRYVCIEIRSTHDGQAPAIAEVTMTSPDGKPVPRESWRASYVSSEDTQAGNLTADKAYDLQESTAWRAAQSAAAPHMLMIDLGAKTRISSVSILPWADGGANGIPADVRIFVR